MQTPVIAGALLVLASSTHTAPLTPEQLKQVDTICAKTSCRAGGYDVVVRVDKTHFMDVPVGRSPIITPEGDILIYPDETLAVQFTVSGDTLSAPRLVAQYATRGTFAMQIDTGSTQTDNPLNTSLPALPQKDGATDMSALPPNTMVITYGQFKGQTGMAMNMESNLPATLKLDATLSRIGKNGYEWHYTSTCPLRKASYETWPGPMGPIRLSHFRFLADSAKMMCE